MTAPPSPTQPELLLELLRQRREAGVTPLQALELIGSLRLAAVVHRLKQQGHDIQTELVATPCHKHVARYTLVERPVQLGLRL